MLRSLLNKYKTGRIIIQLINRANTPKPLLLKREEVIKTPNQFLVIPLRGELANNLDSNLKKVSQG